MSLRRPVYFIGADVACAPGRGVDAAVAACLEGRVIPQLLTLPALEGSMSMPYHRIDDKQSPHDRLAAVVATALAQAGLSAQALRRTGLFIGTSSGDIGAHEQAYAEERAAGASVIAIRQPYHGDMAEKLARDFSLGGPRYTFSTACSAGANALLYAAWMIRESRLDHALVLGVELRNQLTPLGFSSMLLIARGACRPFDPARNGIILGEAVAATLLSADRGDASWRLLGGATLCDISHPTNPAPDKIAAVIRRALDDAQLAARDIAAIKAHGTGTPSNDLGEGLGIREAFADTPPPMTSIKPVLGHTLGACGVVETLVLQACIDAGALPPTCGFQETDPAIGIAPIAQRHPMPRAPLLLNYFGFGGNNCSLVMAPC